LKWAAALLCGFTGVGACYLYNKQVLIENGKYGFSWNNGRPEILFPGRHLLASPLNSFSHSVSTGENLIQMGPISIIRVPEGKLGFCLNDALPEILLPGLHVRNNAAFIFGSLEAVDQELITYGPIKMFAVRSGEVRICYDGGAVQIFKEGRYAVNSGVFQVGQKISVCQQNLRFEKHLVLLDGGINMLVEGLLTFQVIDVETLVRGLGDRDMLRTVQDVTKAEITRVFAGIHLEQIAAASEVLKDDGLGHVIKQHATHTVNLNTGEELSEAKSVLGKDSSKMEEGQYERWKMCAQVMSFVQPVTKPWGIKIINFQIESTKIADLKYAQEYEEASLAMAKAKANLRAVNAENEILLNRARAKAEAVKIEAEGKRNAVLIAANANAEARTVEARARNTAGELLTNGFAKQYALVGQQVEFAAALKANVLAVLPDSIVGKAVAAQPLLSGSGVASEATAGWLNASQALPEFVESKTAGVVKK